MNARDFLQGDAAAPADGEAQAAAGQEAAAAPKLSLPPLKLIAQTVAARASAAAPAERQAQVRQNLVDVHTQVIDDLQLEEAWAQFGLPVDLPPGKRLMLGAAIILGTSVAAVVGEAIAARGKGSNDAQPDGSRGRGAAAGAGQPAQPAGGEPPRGN